MHSRDTADGLPPPREGRSRGARWKAAVVLLGLVCGLSLLASVAVYAMRMTTLDKLLKFDASIYATYGSYQYTPPTTVDFDLPGDSSFKLVFRGGQRVHAFNVRGTPSKVARWCAAVLGQSAHRAFADVVDIAVFNPSFGDEDVRLLLRFGQLRELDLSGTGITDEGASRLGDLELLTVLDLSYTKVTDNAMLHLDRLEHLRELDLSGTAVSQAAIDAFEKRHPECTVFD